MNLNPLKWFSRSPTAAPPMAPATAEQRSVENPAFAISPAQLDNILGFGPTRSGVQVNEFTALTFTAVFAAIKILSESVGMLPLAVYEGDEDSPQRVRRPDHETYKLLRRSPNPQSTPIVFQETLMGHLASWGNCYARILFDGAGNPKELLPLLPDRTRPERYGGQLRYTVGSGVGLGDDAQGGRFAPEEILHVPGLSFNGIGGYSPIGMAREMIAAGKAQEIFGATFFGNGATMQGIIKSPQKLQPQQEQALREALEARHAGVGNAHKTMVLSGGADYVPIGIKPDEAQFLQSRQFSVIEVARIYRIPPHLLASQERSTHSNIEQASLEFLTYTLVPWLIKFEQEFTRKLFPNDSGLFCRFDERRLLRADMAARQNYYAVARQWGWYSANDVRADEGLQPIAGDAGNVYLSPVNMMDASKVSQMPVPSASNSPSGGAPAGGGMGGAAPGGGHAGQGKGSPGGPGSRALIGVLEDSIGRMLRKESNAAGRGKNDEGFYVEHRQHIKDSLWPSIQAMAAIHGKSINRDHAAPVLAVMDRYADKRHHKINGDLAALAAAESEEVLEELEKLFVEDEEDFFTRDWVTIDGNHVFIKDGGSDGGTGGTGGKGHGSSKEDPIGELWRKQAKKMSTPKLKEALKNNVKWNGKNPNEIAKLAQKIIKEELGNRGVEIHE